jgi:hypothetical protein
LVRGWVRLYTAGLNPDHRAERCDEIISDLWEHRSHAAAERQAAATTSLVILGRWLAGIPADLSWRAQAVRRRSNRRDTSVTSSVIKNWWQVLSAITAVVSVYFGLRQYLTDEISTQVTPGKVGALIVFLAFGGLIVGGLANYRRSPRRGATMVMVGLAPVALLGGLGLGLIVGVVVAIADNEGWWWLPTGIASLVATAAFLGAFSAWWNATPARAATSARSMLLPAVLIVIGLVVAVAAGLGMGLNALGLAGMAPAIIGLFMWSRRLKSA